MPGAGSQMFLGIQLQLDSKGVVTGASAAEASLEGVASSAQRAQRSVTNSASTMEEALKASVGVGAIGGALVGVGKVLSDRLMEPGIEQAKNFQVEMSQLKFVTQASAEELDRLRKVAIATGLETQFSPQQAAGAIRMLKAAGLDTEKALQSLQSTLDIVTGSAGGIELQAGATATAAALLKFTRTGESAKEIMDAFAQSTRETNMQMRDLPIIINSLRDAPARMKMTAAQTFALVGLLRSSGMQAAQAGQSVAIFANKFIMNQRRIQRFLDREKITEEQLLAGYQSKTRQMPHVVKAFQKLGVQLFDNQGGLRGMNEFLVDLINSSKRLGKEGEKSFSIVASSIFGARASSVMSALKMMKRGTKEGADAWMDLVGSIGGTKTAARESAAAFENTQAGMEQFIQGTKETIDILMGETLLPYLSKFSLVSRQFLNWVLGVVQSNPQLARAIGITTAAFAGLLTVSGLLLVALASVFFWSVAIAPAIAAAGGVAVVAAKGFLILKASMSTAMGIASGLMLAFLAIQAAVVVWDRLMLRLSQNSKDSLGKISGYLGLVKDALVDGFLAAFSDAMGMVVSGLELFADAIASVIIWFQKLSGTFDGTGLENHIKGWRVLGYVLGWVATIMVARLIKNMVSLTISMVRSTFAALNMAKTIVVAGSGATGVFGRLAVAIGTWSKSMAIGLKGAAVEMVGLLRRMGTAVWAFISTRMAPLLASMRAWAISLWRIAVVHIPRMVAALIRWSIQMAIAIVRHVVLAAIMVGKFIVAAGLAVTSIAAMTTAWIANAAAMLIALAPYIAIAAAVILVGAAFVWVLSKAWELGEWLGVALYESVDKASVALSGFWSSITGWFTGLIESAGAWGTGLWEAFKNGLASGWEGVKGWLWNKIQWIRDLLPGSDAAMGPLSNLTESGRGLMTTLRRGAEETSPQFEGIVSSTVAGAIPSAAESAAPSRGPTTLTIEKIEVTANGSSPAEAERLTKEIMARIREELDNDQEVSFA